MARTDEDVIHALRRALQPHRVVTEPAVRAAYERDWTGRWQGSATAVVRPGTSLQVNRVVQVCAEFGVPVVPQGGNTGLVGGGVPMDGGVVLSLERLRAMEPVDETTGTVVVEAGVTLAELQRHVARAGWAFGVDLASRDSATVGGLIATDAGGIHVVRHGTMRRQVAGVVAVLGDGRAVSSGMAAMEKHQSGYDLTGLMVGSEGTLGVVTTARLRLVRPAPHRVAALLGLSDVDTALDLLATLRRLPSLAAVELMVDEGVRLVAEHAGMPLPFAPLPPVLLLVECADRRDPTEELAQVLQGLDTVAVATERQDRERLWAYRERHSEAINARGVPHKLDVAVPPSWIPALLEDIDGLRSESPEIERVVVFGHLAEGNLHVNLLGRHPDADTSAAEEHLMHRVLSYGGSVAAEHGVGRRKRDWLPRALPAEELAVMRAVKAALDPAGVMNPGVLL